MFGIIGPANTKTVVGSDFPDDGDLQKVNNKYPYIVKVYIHNYNNDDVYYCDIYRELKNT